jgi:hypothetical protein
MATTIADADRDDGFGLPLADTLSEVWGSGTGADSWVWFEVLPRIDGRRVETVVSESDELLDTRMVFESLQNHALVALDRLREESSPPPGLGRRHGASRPLRRSKWTERRGRRTLALHLT